MIIREFLCIHESGTVLFHRKYQTGNSTDIILRSGLISALYNYATAVENDAIDILQMSKVSLFFKKREQPLLFVIFIESTINPQWCEKEIDYLLERFFLKFPEVMWQREVVDLAIFDDFTEDADEILLPLGKKIALLLFLIEDGLLTEKEYLQEALDTLGRKIGSRLLEKNHDVFKQALSKGQNFVLARIDQLIMQLDGEHVKREDLKYFLRCNDCFFCKVEKNGCFFEEFLSSLLSSMRIDDVEINIIE